MASIFPADAIIRAVKSGISLARAAINTTSELKGRIVAAKNAEKNNPNSAMRCSQLHLL